MLGGGHGAASIALALAPLHRRCTDLEQQQHLFQCHSPPKTRCSGGPPSPPSGYDEPVYGHATPVGGTDTRPTGRRHVGTPGLYREGDGAASGTRSTGIPPQGLRPGIWHEAGAAGGCGPLEDIDLVPLDAVQVIIQRQQHLRSKGSAAAVSRGGWGQQAAVPVAAGTYQEGAEHGDGGEEVPNVMVVKEVKQDAVAVVLPGLGRCFLSGTGPAVTAPACGRPGSPPRHPPTYLPGAEPLEEEEEGKAPHH